MAKYLAYIRLSTQKQSESGLGEADQLATVKAFAAARGCEIKKIFIEYESGRDDDRPELAKAIKLARSTGHRILIARMNRLTRSIRLLVKLRDAKVQFTACDMPDATDLTANLLVSVAEQEAKNIARDTKAAMAVSKARGPKEGKLHIGSPVGIKAVGGKDEAGNWVPADVLAERLAEYRAMGRAAHSAKAKDHALRLEDTLAEIRSEGITSLSGIAKALNARDILTTDREPSPGDKRKWRASGVARLKARIAAAQATV